MRPLLSFLTTLSLAAPLSALAEPGSVAATSSARLAALEARIAKLMEEEELSKIRPDLDGAQVMEILNLKPSREVGQAMDFLMELRLEQGPIGEEAATKALLEWWASR